MPHGALPARIAMALVVAVCGACFPAHAQSLTGHDLPGASVTAPCTKTHGGYVVSGNFRVDQRMPTVVFPAEALVQGNILSVRPVHLNDDEYLVPVVAQSHEGATFVVRFGGGSVVRIRRMYAST